MVYAIGQAHGNCLLAARIYNANYSDLHRFPRSDCFEKAKERFEKTENANYNKTIRTHESSSEGSRINISNSRSICNCQKNL